jgi:hypothetical protein
MTLQSYRFPHRLRHQTRGARPSPADGTPIALGGGFC